MVKDGGMLTQEHTDAVMARLDELEKLAEKMFGRTFDSPTVYFDVRGTKGGFHRRGEIHLNPVLLVENFDHYLHQTVGHEYAHFIQRIIYPYSKPHGWEWKHCMRYLGLTPKRCHSYDTSNARVCRRVHKKYTVVCACKEHLVTKRVLDKVRVGVPYRCPKCKTKVKEKSLDTASVFNTMVLS